MRKDMVTGVLAAPASASASWTPSRMFTYNGAYASFDEKIKGSLEPGKLADLIVLSEDILRSDPDHIRDILVDQTYLDGELVFDRNGQK